MKSILLIIIKKGLKGIFIFKFHITDAHTHSPIEEQQIIAFMVMMVIMEAV